ncbi:MAG: hypothetical protein V4515_11940 [Chloroflexota bacterium]
MSDRARRPERLEAEERLAGLHLRAGALLLARAELESLAARGEIAVDALADLAEARWRTGELEKAGSAAEAHIAVGGDRPIAHLILAEAVTAAGRPDAAGDHMAHLRALGAAELTALFAGMPHRANWSSLPAGGIEPRGPKAQLGRPPAAGPAPDAVTGDARPDGQVAKRPAGATFPEGEALLTQAVDDMRSRDPERMAAAFDRLALALRLDPALALRVVDLIIRRQEPAALLVRGDALRILGRTLDAEAAYAGAAAALDRPTRHRP